MVGLRPPSFYDRLRAIPNVVLLREGLNSYDIIRRSSAVFTLSGTAALEAMYLGVPAIILGDLYFRAFRGIHYARGSEDLRSIVRRVLVDPRAAGATTDEAVAALASTYAASNAGKVGATYAFDEIAEPANVRAIVDAIDRELDAWGIEVPH